MTDETVTEPDTTTADPQGDPDGLGDAGKRAIAAERQARAAAEQQARTYQEQLEAATAKAAAFEAANNDLTGQVESLSLDNTRLNVAIDKGLPKGLIGRLQGNDVASFSADADELLSVFPRTATTAPRADPSQGSRGPATPDPAQAFGAALQQALGR